LRGQTTAQRTDGDTASKAGRGVDLDGCSLVVAAALLGDVAVEGVEAGLAEGWDIGWVGLLAFWGLAGLEWFSRLRGIIPKGSDQASRWRSKGDACESRDGNEEE
jgi:hypothetical protein